MRNFSKKFSIIVLLGMFSLSMISVASAGETENSLTGFFRRLFKFPVKATEETTTMTSNTLHNTGEKVLSQAGENTQSIVTGDVAKVTDLATEAVTGTAETVGQTAAETVQVPAAAIEETAAQS